MLAPHAIEIGNADLPAVVFAHGWGRTHRDFIPVAESLAGIAHCILLDLPGFGESERPEHAWGTADYAAFLHDLLITDYGLKTFTWVGHSFGARIGLRMASSDAPIDHLVVVAGAGVPRNRSPLQKVKSKVQSARFRRAKKGAGSEAALIELERRFGSADYVESRSNGLRDIFLSTISEDQTAELGNISCPTTLIYGAKDDQTPPEVGRKIARAINGSRYIECPEFDHISILDRGRHQIALTVKEGLARSC